jgi:hypothetical protein
MLPRRLSGRRFESYPESFIEGYIAHCGVSFFYGYELHLIHAELRAERNITAALVITPIADCVI